MKPFRIPARCASSLFAILMMASSQTLFAADSTAPSGKEKTVTLESVPGSPVKRVTLSARAQERLALQTAAVGEQAVASTQVVGGLVVSPIDVEAAAESLIKKAPGQVWIRVTLSPAEWGRLAKDQPARVLPLATRAKLTQPVSASLSARIALESPRTSMLTVYYVAQSEENGVTPGDRVRVELAMTSTGDKQKAVPYSAVYYDAKGVAWVYVKSGERAYQRQRIAIDRIAGDFALVSEGPADGAQVVTVGAPLLYGAEIFGK
jgi:hypothetical protein